MANNNTKSKFANKNGSNKNTYKGAPKKNSEVIEKAKAYALKDTSGVDGYFRPEVAVGRWKLGYEVFMGNFTKMIGVNLMMLICLLPIFILLFLRTSTIYTNALNTPFSANIGVGYLPVASLVGLEESITYYANYNFFMWVPLAGILLAFGLSGGMYFMRNICWGESVSTVKVFFSGIKKNIWQMIFASMVYTIILSISAIVISHIDLTIALDGGVWYLVLGKVLLYILIGFMTLHFLAMASMIVTYEGNFFQLMKNCFIITAVLLPLNAFFAVLALLPFGVLFLGTQALSLGLILIMFLGSSFTMLVWTVYSQWVYDKFINGKVQPHSATEEEINKHNARVQSQESAREEKGFSEVGKVQTNSIMDGVKPVTDYDVTVGDLNEVFTRDDIDNIDNTKNQL